MLKSKLLTQAFTHRSWLNENKGKRESNERLEFLGDAILEFVVSEKLYELFPGKTEGYLTALRANLVNTKSLGSVARGLGFGEKLSLGKGEEEGGRENPTLLANTFEAVIGAIYLDKGLEEVRKFIAETLLTKLPERLETPLKDAKSFLKEKAEKRGLPAPFYKVVEREGPDHSKSFGVEVLVNGTKAGRGFGKTKAEAEQAAAKKALLKVKALIEKKPKVR